MSPPRDYQIAELTRGVQLPFNSLQRRHLLVILELIAESWAELLTVQEQNLRTKPEPDVNALMKARINQLKGRKTEWNTLVSGVTLGSESCSYDASSIEKRPDLSVHLTDKHRPFDFPLIVECKLIDSANGKDIGRYCEDGIIRFLDGRYAWYAREAFMLAYVRDCSTIANCLTPHLEKNQKKSPDPYLTEQVPRIVAHTFHDVAQSRHGRAFPNNPGAIDVWHLWLS